MGKDKGLVFIKKNKNIMNNIRIYKKVNINIYKFNKKVIKYKPIMDLIIKIINYILFFIYN